MDNDWYLLLVTYQIIAIIDIDCFWFSYLLLICGGIGGNGEGGGFVVAASHSVHARPSLDDGTLAPSFLCSIV